MSKRAVIIDSLVDLPPFFESSLEILSVGFKVYINGKEYTDGIDLTKEEFYDMAVKTDDLRTSYPPPSETLEYYKKLEEKSVEEVLALHLPKKVSGFLGSLHEVLEKVNMKVKVFDLRSLSGGAGLIAAKFIEMFQEGASFEDIERAFWRVRRNLLLQFTVSSLKFLIKNGRIGKAKGLIGSLLNILPVLTVDEEGEVSPLNKVRGRKKVVERMASNVARFVSGKKRIEMLIGWGADAMKEAAMALRDTVFDVLEGLEVKYGEIRISPTVACHAGPEVYGIAIYAE